MLSSSRRVIGAVCPARVLFAFIVLFAACSTHATTTKGDIVVANVHGDVRVTMAGATSPLYVGAILQLPATIRTGKDGSLELRQGPTTVAAAANTELEIPQSAAEDGLIERIVQIRGNAFYNVGKRERTKLRVETPYLVAVIKGTQFNVAAQDDATTIALFEGRLEVRATDESDVIDLRAGAIAIRNRGEPTIRTLQMNATARAPTTNDARAGSDASGSPSSDVSAAIEPTMTATSSVGNESVATNVSGVTSIDAGLSIGDTSAAIEAGISAGSINADVGVGIDANTSVSADVGVGSVRASLDAPVGNGIDASLSAGAGAVAASIDATVGAGGAGVSVDVGAGSLADAAIDTTVGAGAVDASVGANLAGVDADVGVGASASNGIDVSATVSTPAGVGIAVDTNIGGPAIVDTSIDVGGTVGATVDTSGTIAAGVNVGNVVDVDIDLGSRTIDVDVGGNDTGGGIVGGIVGGLLGGRKGK